MKPTILGVTVLALVSSACLMDGFVFEVTDRRPIAAGESYADWWSATEECSGRRGDFTRVRWYTASSITYDAVYARGVWLPPHDIVLLEGYEEHEPTTRHEMLHDLMDGDPHHESAEWTVCDLIDP